MHQKTKRSFWLRGWCLGFSAGAMISVSAMVIQCMRLFGATPSAYCLLLWVSPVFYRLDFRNWPDPWRSYEACLTPPSHNKARVCVEIGLLKENPPNRVLIGSTVYVWITSKKSFLFEYLSSARIADDKVMPVTNAKWRIRNLVSTRHREWPMFQEPMLPSTYHWS